ncbi:hypothetical protein ACLMAB_18075 [Brevibacillus laterosporus]
MQKTALHLGVDTKNDHKEIIVTKIDKRWFRFTLFAPKEKENAVILPQLLAMLKTIMVKNNRHQTIDEGKSQRTNEIRWSKIVDI